MENFLARFEKIVQLSGGSAYKLAKALNTSETIISNIRNGKSKPSFDFMEKILNKYEVLNLNWLLTGTGNMFLNDNSPLAQEAINANQGSTIHLPHTPKGQNVPKNVPSASLLGEKETNKSLYAAEPESIYRRMPQVITVDNQQNENLVFVPARAAAGYLTGYADREYIEKLTPFSLPMLRSNSGTYRMFEAVGNSMEPKIINGDYIIGRYVENLNDFKENQVHIIVTKDGIAIKRLLNRISQRGMIVCKSDTITHRADNKTYQVSPEDVIEIWQAYMRFSGDFSEPAEIYHRVSDLESDVLELKNIIFSHLKLTPPSIKVNDDID